MRWVPREIGDYALLCDEWVKVIAAYPDQSRYQVAFLNSDGLSHVYAPGKRYRWVNPEELQPLPYPQPIWTLGGPDYTAEDEAHEAWARAYRESEICRGIPTRPARQLELFGLG